MKLPVLVLVASLAVNAALLSAFAVKPALAPSALRDFFQRGSPAENTAANDATRAARRKAEATSSRAETETSLWSELQSADLPTLVARLRAAGFPPTIVRAVIDAEIEARFRPRLEALASTARETPFWKADGGAFTGSRHLVESMSQIYRERAQLMRTVLGEDAMAYWSNIDPDQMRRQRYGDISAAKIDLVQRINDDYADMIGQVRASMQGIVLPEDREKLALLEREKRNDLASVLNAEELAEYEMRSSPLTSRLRTPLSIMDATEAEFRTIYQIQQPFADVLAPTAGTTSPTMFEERRAATAKANEQIKAALSPERFAMYQQATQSEFQQLYRLGYGEGLSYDTMSRAYGVRDTVATASTEIMNNRALSPAERNAALKHVAQTARTEILSTLGPAVGPRYADAARWLSHVENGGAVSITPDGNISMRRAPTTPTPTSRQPSN